MPEIDGQPALSKTKPTHVPMSSGTIINLIAPTPSVVHHHDMREFMENQRRFNAQVPWLVGQHSCLVAALMRAELAPYGLLHDGHEVVLQDMTTPMQGAYTSLGIDVKSKRKTLAWEWDCSIYEAYDLPIPNEEIIAEVERADFMALCLERHWFYPHTPDDLWVEFPRPHVCFSPDMFDPKAWDRAMHLLHDQGVLGLAIS